MPAGGKRPGAGRKKGSTTTKTREVAVRAAAEGITPLEVMLSVMREHYEAGRKEEAASIAKDAAPYVHPRLSAVQYEDITSDAEAEQALEEELEAIAVLRAAQASHAPEAHPGPDHHDAPGGNGTGPVAGSAPPE